ncbi:unnamed protein product, partial [Rotaria sp. Silwood1]
MIQINHNLFFFLSYTRSSSPTIPPQLSLIVKNVSLAIDLR